MKREEKNLLSRQKILDSARKEFAAKGYGASSVNALCADGELSKGILYHYFKDKDELYLLCLKECFDGLTACLAQSEAPSGESTEAALERYFAARLAYFSAHPEQQRLFCEAVIAPPAHLREQISVLKAPFDRLNIRLLAGLLSHEVLREGCTLEEVIDTFRQYQDFVNARFQMEGSAPKDGPQRERICQRALNILLYGVIAQKGENER